MDERYRGKTEFGCVLNLPARARSQKLPTAPQRTTVHRGQWEIEQRLREAPAPTAQLYRRLREYAPTFLRTCERLSTGRVPQAAGNVFPRYAVWQEGRASASRAYEEANRIMASLANRCVLDAILQGGFFFTHGVLFYVPHDARSQLTNVEIQIFLERETVRRNVPRLLQLPAGTFVRESAWDFLKNMSRAMGYAFPARDFLCWKVPRLFLTEVRQILADHLWRQDFETKRDAYLSLSGHRRLGLVCKARAATNRDWRLFTSCEEQIRQLHVRPPRH